MCDGALLHLRLLPAEVYGDGVIQRGGAPSISSILTMAPPGALTWLRVLVVPGAALASLDGLALLTMLEELYLSRNSLADLEGISKVPRLLVLDVRNNQLRSADALQALAFCPMLQSLSLAGNPCVASTDGVAAVSVVVRTVVANAGLKLLLGNFGSGLGFEMPPLPVPPTKREKADAGDRVMLVRGASRVLQSSRLAAASTANAAGNQLSSHLSLKGDRNMSISLSDSAGREDAERRITGTTSGDHFSWEEEVCEAQPNNFQATASLTTFFESPTSNAQKSDAERDNDSGESTGAAALVGSPSLIQRQHTAQTSDADCVITTAPTADVFCSDGVGSVRSRRITEHYGWGNFAHPQGFQSIIDTLNEALAVERQAPLPSQPLARPALKLPALPMHPPLAMQISPVEEDLAKSELRASIMTGRARAMDDAAVTVLLQRKPRDVPELATRASFRRFFTGVQRARMKRLLECSCNEVCDDGAGGTACGSGSNVHGVVGVAGELSIAAQDRIARRMALVSDVLIN